MMFLLAEESISSLIAVRRPGVIALFDVDGTLTAPTNNIFLLFKFYRLLQLVLWEDLTFQRFHNSLATQVVGLAALKKYVALLREAAANYYGDLKFSRSSPPSLTLTVCGPSNKGHRFVAAVQLLEPLFSVVSATDDGDYRYQFHLEEFFHALNCTKDDFCLTAIIPESAGKANFLFCSRLRGEERCFFSSKLSPPDIEEVGKFGYKGGFVAIDAERFRDIAKHCLSTSFQFAVTTTTCHNSPILLTAKDRECSTGGLNGVVQFSITMNPVSFFVGASHLTKFVWFFGSADWKTVVIRFIGQHAHVMAYYYSPRG
ncbi:uncharacterized protein LOC111025689 [Momordica charantia]|uniref:Uncharacterized protein LOC111025689 n=1 Tax=Momordica charantia TaxID=3673 RepID=A0A6J1DZE0_MOMCH|nr:uncharacterized protein LOC111025689 [Momordica charantia]